MKSWRTPTISFVTRDNFDKKIKMTTQQLISELTSITSNIIHTTENHFVNAPQHKLTSRTSDKSWNVLECLEHLNLYGDYYLPECKKAIQKASRIKERPGSTYAPGWLGNYFANMMKVKEQGKLVKYSTFKDKNPLNTNLTSNVLQKFLKQQKDLLEILKAAEQVNMEKAAVPITISRFIRLKLGDTLRFVVYHNERHLEQALRVFNHS